MKMKFYTLWTVLPAMALLASCSDEKSSEVEYQTANKTIEAGMEVYSELLLGDEVIEEVIDSVVNLGKEDREILFHVNQSHRVRGIDVPEGPTDIDCSFYSLTRQEMEAFIPLFALMKGLAETDQLTDEQKRQAFEELFYFLRENDIELAPLIYLAQGNLAELQAVDQMIEGMPSRGSDAGNDLNSIFAAMVRSQVRPSELLAELESQGLCFADFITQADLGGVNISGEMSRGMGPVAIIKTVVESVVFFSKLVVAFVEKAQPVVDFESTYVSLLHSEDTDPFNYYNPTHYLLDKDHAYVLRYGTKLTPMAECQFGIEMYYDSKNDKFRGWTFVSRIGVLPYRVRCMAGMHVEGRVTFGPAQTYIDQDGDVEVYSENEVQVDYGDALCFSRHGRLRFNASSFWGFRPTEWKQK